MFFKSILPMCIVIEVKIFVLGRLVFTKCHRDKFRNMGLIHFVIKSRQLIFKEM